MIANLLEPTSFIHRKYFQYVKVIKRWKIYLTFYERMGILFLKKWQMQKRNKPANVWGLCYRWSPFAASQFLSHTDWSIKQMVHLFSNDDIGFKHLSICQQPSSPLRGPWGWHLFSFSPLLSSSWGEKGKSLFFLRRKRQNLILFQTCMNFQVSEWMKNKDKRQENENKEIRCWRTKMNTKKSLILLPFLNQPISYSLRLKISVCNLLNDLPSPGLKHRIRWQSSFYNRSTYWKVCTSLLHWKVALLLSNVR